jgi:hypothetical protein
MPKIITAAGEILNLTDWQKRKGYILDTQLGKYFTTKENKLSGDFILHEYLFLILDKLREYAKKPIIINSAYRTELEQRELQKTNKGAVSNSPHVWGLAIDIDTRNNKETENYVRILRIIANELNLKIRLGFTQYQNMKPAKTFIHLDVTPEMFGVGKPWQHFPNIPQVYKSSIEW